MSSFPAVDVASSAAPVLSSSARSRASEALGGWKEIALYMRQGVRTVQRWADELSLPVHRIKNTPRSPVFAFREELDEWMQQRSSRHRELAHLTAPQRRSMALIQNLAVLKDRNEALQKQLWEQAQKLTKNMARLRQLSVHPSRCSERLPQEDRRRAAIPVA